MKLMILTPTHAFTRLLTGRGSARREKLRLVIKDIIMTLRQLLIMNNQCWLIALQLNAIQRQDVLPYTVHFSVTLSIEMLRKELVVIDLRRVQPINKKQSLNTLSISELSISKLDFFQ